MKLVYMGTPDFAVPTLETLINSKHEVVAVVTQPDKPKGRGKEVQYTPVKKVALKYNIPVYQPVKVRDSEFVSLLRELNADAIIVAAFGQILSKEIIDMPPYGCINVHASLLPKYRGAAPIQWCVINGEKETGITAMHMDTGIDTGDMLKKVIVPIDEKETGSSLHDKLSVLGGPIILETLDELEKGTIIPEKQDDSQSCNAKMLSKTMGKIDWNLSAVVIERLIRGLNSWPSAFTSYKGKTLKIWEADVLPHQSATPGEILEQTKDSLLVATGDGVLAIKEVQLEGKKRMKIDAFLRGNSVENGTILGMEG